MKDRANPCRIVEMPPGDVMEVDALVAGHVAGGDCIRVGVLLDMHGGTPVMTFEITPERARGLVHSLESALLAVERIAAAKAVKS